MPPEVLVSGYGVWTCLGGSVNDLVEAIRTGQGRAQSTAVPGVDRSLPLCAAPDPPPHAGLPQVRRMDRSVVLALAAADAALASAPLSELPLHRIAILAGTSRGPFGKCVEPAPARVRPTQAAHTAMASLSGALSLAYGIQGPCLTVSATCASGGHAIALAAMMIRAGVVDAALAGGAEAPLVPKLLAQFAAAGIVGSHDQAALACRPFDRSRNGTVPGEGAAFLVLESADSARRHARPGLARLAGTALGSESHSRAGTRPDGATLARVMEDALRQAGIGASHLGHVNAHGTGTRLNDAAEAAALRAVLGSHVREVPVASTKPVTGHAFGAAAAIEAVLAIESLRRAFVPPTAGCTELDPALGLDVVTQHERTLTRPWVMSNSLGFWGNAASLLFTHPGS